MVPAVPTTALPAPPSPAGARAASTAPALAWHPSPVDVAFVRDVSRVEHARRIGSAWLRNVCRMRVARVDSAEVVISELITNAVVYGRGNSVGLRMRHVGGQVRLEVNDYSPSAVPGPVHVGWEMESGRGLWLVDTLIDELGGRWGFTVDGAVAWCIFPIAPIAPSASYESGGPGPESRGHDLGSKSRRR
ncbi:ATP-binding protein [Streptomyces sp. NPDC050549]|uniref:ATP-binding protein n=1 Tax=Streptomyces sp. NPDC050549 TaxID=3155406 RepID=UPI003428F6C1